jgi:hypothetical protein
MRDNFAVRVRDTTSEGLPPSFPSSRLLTASATAFARPSATASVRVTEIARVRTAWEREDREFMFVSPRVRLACPSDSTRAMSAGEETGRVTTPSTKIEPVGVCRMRGPSSSSPPSMPVNEDAMLGPLSFSRSFSVSWYISMYWAVMRYAWLVPPLMASREVGEVVADWPERVVQPSRPSRPVKRSAQSRGMMPLPFSTRAAPPDTDAELGREGEGERLGSFAVEASPSIV